MLCEAGRVVESAFITRLPPYATIPLPPSNYASAPALPPFLSLKLLPFSCWVTQGWLAVEKCSTS